MTSVTGFTRRASISDVLHLVDDALDELGAPHQMRDVEALGVLVHEAMSLDSRHYHDVSHAVSVAAGGDAIEKLSGLFHDVVYHHVDRGFAPTLAPLVEPFVEFDNGSVRLASKACAADRRVQIALQIFGICAGERLKPQAGQNELLSAIVAAKALEEILPEADLVQVIACIEATIPFRGCGKDGSDNNERLAWRLSEVNQEFALGLDRGSLEQCLVRAANVSNRDLASFARDDVTEFLAETWLLFAETNPLLARKRGFFIADYRRSLVEALGFFQYLDPDTVFRSYKGSPPAETVHQLTARVRENVERGTVYLKMKVVGIAMVEALARLTGGDTLVAMFMGHVRYGDEYGERLEDHLPDPVPGDEPIPSTSSSVYRLLSDGRAAGSRFDMPNSPITAFMHERLGEAGVLELYPYAASITADEGAPKEFLEHVRADVLHDVVQACKQIAWTRAEDLEHVMRQRSG